MKWKKLISRLCILIGLMAVVVCGLWFFLMRPIVPNGEVGEVQYKIRPYQHFGINDGEYESGVFFVPENRNEKDSRVIAIDYARFQAAEQSGPPVFLLPGGPGNTYIHNKGQWLGKAPPYLEKLRAHCDVILVNQRGYNPRRRDKLGYWKRTVPSPDWSLDDEIADYTKFAEKAVAHFKDSKVDLRGYNIIECAADVNDLRKALGYEKIVLMGQSFGSQWSFAVMRTHPEIVERAILTGVEPLSHTYDMPSHLMNATRRIWNHLESDPNWAPYIPEGGMEAAAEAVLTRLENGGVEVNDHANGKLKFLLGPDDFPWDQPAQILELYHGQTDRWVKGRGLRQSYYNLIFPLIDSSIGVSPERLEQLNSDPAARYISRGTSMFAQLLATADIWPTSDVGNDFRKPIQSDIPVLFIHGDWDRSTPIENTLFIAPWFTMSHTLLVKRGGHSPLLQMQDHPKVLDAILNFAVTGDTNTLPDSITIKPDLGRIKTPPRFKLPPQSSENESDGD